MKFAPSPRRAQPAPFVQAESVSSDLVSPKPPRRRRRARPKNGPTSFPAPSVVSAPASELLFVPLGGCNQIGMNMSLYGFDGKWIIVDAGIAFADEDETPGVQAFMPDPRFIEERMDDVLALIVTHAHEDHIGAIHRLWPRLACPVYATPFAARVIRGRLAEQRTDSLVAIRTFKPGSRFKIGPFEIDSIPMTHSVPEMQAFAIKTPAGAVLHTGDWKLDPKPLVGQVSDIAKLERLGQDGVLAMVCDSTNAAVPGSAGSETDARNGLIQAFAGRRGAIAVACFASNIARMSAVAVAATATGRRVALVGRSLKRMEEAARACGYLKNVPEFLDEREIMALPRRQRVILCTGSQGEERSALSRIAHGAHRWIQLDAGDTVFFSARAIPGKEAQIEAVCDKLRVEGVEIVTAADLPIHVSGHPCQADLKRVYELARPQILVPVHGTPDHLAAHAAFAEACGVPQTAVPTDGIVLSLSKDGARVVERFEPGLFAYDGQRLHPWTGPRPRMAPPEEAYAAGETAPVPSRLALVA